MVTHKLGTNEYLQDMMLIYEAYPIDKLEALVTEALTAVRKVNSYKAAKAEWQEHYEDIDADRYYISVCNARVECAKLGVEDEVLC